MEALHIQQHDTRELQHRQDLLGHVRISLFIDFAAGDVYSV